MCVLFAALFQRNPHRLHSEPFPPQENHNVGLLRFDDDHDHICYRFAQVQIFGGKSNVFKSLQCLNLSCLRFQRPQLYMQDYLDYLPYSCFVTEFL
jgi:hypothetical protein